MPVDVRCGGFPRSMRSVSGSFGRRHPPWWPVGVFRSGDAVALTQIERPPDRFRRLSGAARASGILAKRAGKERAFRDGLRDLGERRRTWTFFIRKDRKECKGEYLISLIEPEI